MIMGPFGLNGLILDISGDTLFGWLIFHPTALSLGGVSVRENVANAIKCQICNGEKARSCGIVRGLEMARSATGTKSLF
jgi:hypothetical protein